MILWRRCALLALAALLAGSLAADGPYPQPKKRKGGKVVRKATPSPTPAPTPTPTPPPPPPARFAPAFDENPVVEVPPAPAPSPIPTPRPTPAPEGWRVSVLAGALGSMATEADVEMSPLARVAGRGPLPLPGVANSDRLPRFLTTIDFTALPGDTLNILTGPQTFRAVEARFGLAQRIAEVNPTGQRIVTSLYIEAGFATRFTGDAAPADRTARWGMAGVRLDELRSGSYIAFGIDADQRLDGRYQPALLLDGAVELYREDQGALTGARMLLIGGAVLGLDYRYDPHGVARRRNVVRVGLTVGR